LDSKLTFREHINYMAKKCTKLTFALFKSAKINWGAKTRNLEDNIHRRNTAFPIIRITSVEKKTIDKVSYQLKLIRVQRLINIKISKANRTVTKEALCMLTELTPIVIKIEEALAGLYL